MSTTPLLVALVSIMESAMATSQIVIGPTNQNVYSGEDAMFNCSLPCADVSMVFTWYLVLPLTLQKVSISPYTSLSQVQSIYGLNVSWNTINECPSGGYYVEQLVVSRMTKDFDLMPIQCAVLCLGPRCGCTSAQIYFSTVAVVRLMSQIVEPTRVVTPSSARSFGLLGTPIIATSGSIAYNTSAGSTEVVVMESGFGINRQIFLASVLLPPLDLVTFVISAIVVSCIAAL